MRNGPHNLESEGEGSRTPLAPTCGFASALPRAHRPPRLGPGANVTPTPTNAPQASETTPLFQMPSPSQSTPPWYNTQPRTSTLSNSNTELHGTSKFGPGLMNVIPRTVEITIKSLPAVLLGCLLNVLDGVSWLAFLLLGALKLGTLMDFFPRHILIGCIGGVGAFLIQTGFAVSMRIDEEDFKMDRRMFETMFLDMENLAMWVVPLVLAVLLRVVTSRWNHQLILPMYFLIIPALFYIVISALGTDLSDLRKAGWLFNMGSSESEASQWYTLYSYFTISLDQDVDTDKELVGHGYSNLLSALFGTV
ncbi:hypothetical protein C0995_000992 [Termitomyces sp. Mi166|nr:hypothetical protein C0995_000992 [Termitomyces sp. Mi166\